MCSEKGSRRFGEGVRQEFTECSDSGPLFSAQCHAPVRTLESSGPLCVGRQGSSQEDQAGREGGEGTERVLRPPAEGSAGHAAAEEHEVCSPCGWFGLPLGWGAGAVVSSGPQAAILGRAPAKPILQRSRTWAGRGHARVAACLSSGDFDGSEVRTGCSEFGTPLPTSGEQVRTRGGRTPVSEV